MNVLTYKKKRKEKKANRTIYNSFKNYCLLRIKRRQQLLSYSHKLTLAFFRLIYQHFHLSIFKTQNRPVNVLTNNNAD